MAEALSKTLAIQDAASLLSRQPIGNLKHPGISDVTEPRGLAGAWIQVACRIGPSGSGKSTLLRCATGLEPVRQLRVDTWQDWLRR